MAKHTPGPWIVCDDDLSDYYLVGPHYGDGIVYKPVVKLHSEANAHLIAAAPDLLETAIQLLRNFPTDCDLIEAGWGSLEIERAMRAHENARAIIAKATGQT